MVRREHNLRGWSVTPGSEHTSMYTGRYRCREDRRVPTCFIKADKEKQRKPVSLHCEESAIRTVRH